jgi:hypothetical protein
MGFIFTVLTLRVWDGLCLWMEEAETDSTGFDILEVVFHGFSDSDYGSQDVVLHLDCDFGSEESHLLVDF